MFSMSITAESPHPVKTTGLESARTFHAVQLSPSPFTTRFGARGLQSPQMTPLSSPHLVSEPLLVWCSVLVWGT